MAIDDTKVFATSLGVVLEIDEVWETQADLDTDRLGIYVHCHRCGNSVRRDQLHSHYSSWGGKKDSVMWECPV